MYAKLLAGTGLREMEAPNNKQLLDEVLVIYRIIKVEVGIIRRS